MILKKITAQNKCEIIPLNNPNWDIYELPQVIKTASVNKDGDYGEFDIKSEVEKHPDHLYVKIFAIKKDEVNDNGDAFSEEELMKAAHTFVGVPLFTNHQNDDIEKAKGECIHSWYNKESGGIYIIGKVDQVAYPKLARGIKEGYINATSMGTSVTYSICSVCHNLAHTADFYCSHVKERKNHKFSGSIKCDYFKSDGDIEDQCPLCGSTKEQIKTISHNDQPIFEHNYGLKFIENSFVVNPACHDCGVCEILHVPNFKHKVAQLNERVQKLSSTYEKSEENSTMKKIAGVQEIEYLKNSMAEVEKVVKSMFEQKDNVSMEFVSDLVKAMSDIQGTMDELIEVGYTKLPSPNITAEGISPTNIATPSPILPEQMTPVSPSPTQVMDTGTTNIQDMGGLGTMTVPKKSSKSLNKKEDFLKLTNKLYNKIASLRDSIDKNRREEVKGIYVTATHEGEDMRIIISQEEDDIFITKAKGDKIIQVSHITEFPEDIQILAQSEPDKAANKILNKELGLNMKTNQSKTAATQENQEIITEKQLVKEEEDIGKRLGSTYEGITESKEQFGKESDVRNDTTSESPQTRKGTYPVITEGQLTMSTDGAIVRTDDVPEVITEKQWDEMSRLVSAKLSADWTDVITEAQLKDLLSSHRFVGPYDVITEGQLKGMDFGVERWANTNYTKQVVKIAEEAISDIIAHFRKTPQEIAKFSNQLSENPQLKERVIFTTILNSLPYKKEARKDMVDKFSYFNRFASSETTKIADVVTVGIANHAKHGIDVSDVIDTISHLINGNSKIASRRIEQLVQKKMGNVEEPTFNKSAAMDSALKELDKPEDGVYQVRATVEDIGIKPLKTNKSEFLAAVKKHAQSMIDTSENITILEVQLTSDGDIVISTFKDTDMLDEGESELTSDNFEPDVGDDVGDVMNGVDEEVSLEGISPEEDTSPCRMAKKRETLIKQAQMMGGEMGGQGGMSQAPGAGATLPNPPGTMDAPPVESFGAEPGGMGEDVTEEDLEPLPPGTACPVCTSKDVDVVGGKGKCNNCGSDWVYKTVYEILNNAYTDKEGVEGGEVSDEFEGEGFEMPENQGLPPMAAMTRIKPEALKKIAEAGIKLGSVSPITGTTNTIDLDNNEHICLDTGSKYKVSFVTEQKDPKKIYAQWEWTPVRKNMDCPSCRRSKNQLIKTMKEAGVTEEQFDKMTLEEKSKTIISLKKAGKLQVIKTASKNGSVKEDIKKVVAGYQQKFPIESCIEKLARRFGKDALALSGPCEGHKLADCVCNQLKQSNVYSNRLAIKLAEVWSDKCGSEECLEDQIRLGYSIKDATTICEVLKIALASPEDMLAEELTDDVDPVAEDATMLQEDSFPEEDPFENTGETITINLPIDVVEKIVVEKIEESVSEVIDESPIEELPVSEDISPDEIVDTDNGVEEVLDEAIETTEENPDEIEAPVETPFEESTDEITEVIDGNEDVADEGEEFKEGEEIEDTEEEEEYDFDEASHMASRIGHNGRISLDLISVAKKLAQSKEIRQENVQDSPDIGKYTGGEDAGTIGKETPPKAAKPSVPRSDATIGKEPSDLNPKDKPQPKIPSSDSADIGHEKEQGYTGGDDRYTGGHDGQGKTETASVEEDLMHMKGYGKSSEGLGRLAERIQNLQQKNAADKKLEPKKPVSDDEDIKPIKGKSTIGKEDAFTADEPTNTEGSGNESLMGHENETVGDRPTSPKDHPSIPADNQTMGEEGKEIAPEKQTRDKGTVIANSNEKSDGLKTKEAMRVAGRMLEAKLISVDGLQQKIAELSSYQTSQIRDIERSVFSTKKGLDTAPEGISQPVIINEKSSAINASGSLTNKLQGMFSLDKRNKLADSDDDIDLRRAYGRL